MTTTALASNEPERPGGPIQRIVASLVLPPTMSAFEQNYLRRMNRIALAFFYLHLPVLVLLSWINDTGPLLAGLLTAACLVPQTVAFRTFASERNKSLVAGFTAMCLGGVLVHVGQGPVQIEMHFYFFSVLAMLALFANPMVILVAAGTVSVHHLALWFAVPDSVFNYDAPLWVVLVHALFVVLETVAACFIARNFFDNVIGLEQKVEQRTAEIRARNRDMRIVLDNVRQGLVTIDAQGKLASEHSQALEDWFGGYEAGETFAAYMDRSCPQFGRWFGLNWENLAEGFLPLELTIDQLPKTLTRDGRHYSFDYEPIVDDAGELQKVLVVVSDVTADVEHAQAQARQREILTVFEKVLNDRHGFVEFCEETSRLLDDAERCRQDDLDATKRHVHTVKGNAGVFGIESVAELCHQVETHMADGDRDRVEAGFAALRERWNELSESSQRLLGQQGQDSVSVPRDEHERILRLAIEGADHADIARALVDLTLEPTELRLGRFAQQAHALAERLAKGEIEVRIDSNGLRLDRERFAPFWSSFSHVVRNAVDHGIEDPELRAERGKPQASTLHLRTFQEGDDIVLEVRDDGRGIDWNAVREKARALDLESSDGADLVEILFRAGLTTKSQVSDVSGRGVGLAAVREACEGLGGSIAVESEPGEGTLFRFTFPASLKAEYPTCHSVA